MWDYVVYASGWGAWITPEFKKTNKQNNIFLKEKNSIGHRQFRTPSWGRFWSSGNFPERLWAESWLMQWPVKQDHFFDKPDQERTTRKVQRRPVTPLLDNLDHMTYTHVIAQGFLLINMITGLRSAPLSLKYQWCPMNICLSQRLKEKHSAIVSAQWSNNSKHCLLEKYQRSPAD